MVNSGLVMISGFGCVVGLSFTIRDLVQYLSGCWVSDGLGILALMVNLVGSKSTVLDGFGGVVGAVA